MSTYTTLHPSNSGVEAAPISGRKANQVLAIGLLAAGWLLVFNRLRVDWSINPQYYYGWVVPLLALGLFYFRWNSRPAPSPLADATTIAIISSVALVLLFPIRLVEEANPEWRLILWVHALQMAFVTLCAFAWLGGWAWVRHFAFPVCFLLVAVPWPIPLEQRLIQGLMRGIAGITVEAVGLLNIPALQHGNIIQISSGLVGIDEACSGVRSLQTTIFVSLFLGELYRFSLPRRLALLGASITVALIANVARTFFLVWSASRHGLEKMHTWHDTAGTVVLIATLLGIWFIGQFLNRKQPVRPRFAAALPAAASLPRPFLIAVASWLLCVEVVTELWYRSHETGLTNNASWSINWPAVQSHSSRIELSETVRAMLRFSEGRAVAWSDAGANQWQLFLLRWASGKNSAQLAKSHTPEICLQGIGYQLTSDVGTRILSVGDLRLPFRQYTFGRGGQVLHVFYCLWEDRPSLTTSAVREDGTQSSRLLAVREGRRHLGQQALEVAIRGPATPEAALAAFQDQLVHLIQR